MDRVFKKNGINNHQILFSTKLHFYINFKWKNNNLKIFTDVWQPIQHVHIKLILLILAFVFRVAWAICIGGQVLEGLERFLIEFETEIETFWEILLWYCGFIDIYLRFWLHYAVISDVSVNNTICDGLEQFECYLLNGKGLCHWRVKCVRKSIYLDQACPIGNILDILGGHFFAGLQNSLILDVQRGVASGWRRGSCLIKSCQIFKISIKYVQFSAQNKGLSVNY